MSTIRHRALLDEMILTFSIVSFSFELRNYLSHMVVVHKKKKLSPIRRKLTNGTYRNIYL